MKKLVHGIMALAFVFTLSLALNAQDVPQKQKVETKKECKAACDKTAKKECCTAEAKKECKTTCDKTSKKECTTEAKKDCATKK